MPSPVLDLPSEHRAWFMKLNDDIWKYHTDPGTQRRYAVESRELTQEELDRAIALIGEFDLVCEMESANLGFDVGIRVFAHEVVPGTEPEFLACITGPHLPGYKKKLQAATSPSSLDVAWPVFEPLVARESNKRFLEFYKLDHLREKTHYEY